MTVRAPFAVLLIVVVAATAGLPSQGPAQESPRGTAKDVRLLFDIAESSFAVEGDLVRWQGVSLVTSLHRWPFPNHGCAHPGFLPGGRPPSPTCTPDGWGLGLGFRAVPHPRDRIGLYVQGEGGVYRYDGVGILTTLLAGRVGLFMVLGSEWSVETGVKVQRMAGYEWLGFEYPAKVVGAWQFGVGIPVH